MNTFIEKTLGYILLCVGLACILFALFSMYNVFTDVTSPPEIFKMESLRLSTTFGSSGQMSMLNIPLDPEMRKTVDMILYYLLMFFVVIAGSAISSLGIKLIKDIKVVKKS